MEEKPIFKRDGFSAEQGNVPKEWVEKAKAFEDAVIKYHEWLMSLDIPPKPNKNGKYTMGGIF
jgi:hypothetical protein